MSAVYCEKQGAWVREGRWYRESEVASKRCSIKPATTVTDCIMIPSGNSGKRGQNMLQSYPSQGGGWGKLWHLLTLSHQSLAEEFPSGGIYSGPPCVGKVSFCSPSTKIQLLLTESRLMCREHQEILNS